MIIWSGKSRVSLLYRLCLCCLLLCLRTAKSFSQQGVYNLGDLSRLAPIIVVGQISPSGSDSRLPLSLTISRVIKGDLAAGASISVHWTPISGRGCSMSPPSAAVYGIWFLEKGESGAFQFLQVLPSQSCHLQSGDFAVPQGDLSSEWTYGSKNSAAFALAQELVRSTVIPAGPSALALQKDRNLLSGIPENEALAFYKKLSASSDEQNRMLGPESLLCKSSTRYYNSKQFSGNVCRCS